MRTLKISFLVFILSITISAQWEMQSPLPNNRDLNAVQFINSNVGWTVGLGCTIIKTTDGGENWKTQISLANGQYTFWSLHFSDLNSGCVVGSKLIGNQGAIFRTTNGGNDWVS